MASADSDGAPAILRQLELPFEDILALTDEDRVQNWLTDRSPNSPEEWLAFVWLRDAETRRSRATRWARIRAIQEPFDDGGRWLIPGGQECLWLYDQAEQAYVE